MNNNYYVYILTNKYKTVFYTGVTNDLYRRTLEHKMKVNDGFSEKYNADCLVYYELFFNITDAIKREERLKRWKRKWKMELIEKFNTQWKDLFGEIGDACSRNRRCLLGGRHDSVIFYISAHGLAIDSLLRSG